MYKSKSVDPATVVIFGATGELSRERLIPALYHLFDHNLLPKIFSIVGFARSEFTNQAFRDRVKPQAVGKPWKKFAKKIHYVSGNFTNLDDFAHLGKFLHGLETSGHSCANRLFYFSTLPSHYETISESLDKAGLLVACAIHKRQTRVVIEKPFCQDLKSAQKLDRSLNKYFAENQIYRIDHYLGKETVQNLLTVRFANSIFEPVWNRNYINHIQISTLEDGGIGNRGAYYEQVGAIRDVLQNHLMQLLALTAMEPPNDLSPASIRDERSKVIKAIRKPAAREIKNSLVLAQYQGYTDEPHVFPKSRVETYAALKLFIENARWGGVPFYLRTGKKLKQKSTQISLHFKPAAAYLFADQKVIPNVLIFKIQPNEGIFLNLVAKHPGFGIRLHPVTMELGYHTAFEGEIPEAYERLLRDFIQGDQRLFARSDEIEYSWQYIDVLENFLKKSRIKPRVYKPGTWGPVEAEELLKKDNRQWQII